MKFVAPSAPLTDPTLADRMATSLSRRYALVLIGIGAMLVVDQAVLQPRMIRLSIYAPRINMAGRQRMLSQRLVKDALAIASAESEQQRSEWRHELGETLVLWRQSHAHLLAEVEETHLSQMSRLELPDAFARLEPHFHAMSTAAAEMLAGDVSNTSITTLLAHENQFLTQMDRIVGLYEQQARTQATTLRIVSLAAAASVMTFLIALGRIVLRPATRLIRQQMQDLEARVAIRTVEVTIAYESLKKEIHNREAAEERSRTMTAQLAHASRVHSLGQLATGLAHEINQPIGAIANYAETCDLLLAGDTPNLDHVRMALGNIRTVAIRAGDIVRSMRNFLRPGEQPRSMAPLGELIHDVVLLCRPEMVRCGVDLELQLQPDPVPLFVAITQMHQVLINLVQNAIQAMQPISPGRRELRISSTYDSDHVQVEVSDTGPGFGDRVTESLFHPFATTKASGLGIGLAIVRTIVQEHGGRVWAENRAVGAAVSFELPLKTSHEIQISIAPDCVCR